ncbi:MAG: lipopolysaccharide heptosyltransferase I [Sulfurospirillum sp.]
MKLAIVKLSALGDIVHAMVVLQYIKKNIPNTLIDWFAEEQFCEVLNHNPHINNIYKTNLKDNKKGILKEYKKLKRISDKESYDLVIDLQGLMKSAIICKILGGEIAGFDKNSIREPLASLFYTKTFCIPYEENIIKRNLKLVSQALNFDIPVLQDKEAFLYSSSVQNYKPTLLIITGSSWKSKIYPKEHFVKIINALDVKTLVAWGNSKEEEDAKYICGNTKAKLLPKLNLDELKNLIANSNLTIGADSGPTHMAWALNRPSITIFGPTPSWRNCLETDINISIDCKNKIDAKKLDKADMCIRDINPQEIINMAKKLLKC